MSVCHVTKIMGLVPKTLEYDKMLNAYNACLEAGVEIPKEVTAFFNLDNYSRGYQPPADGMEVDIKFVKDGDDEYEDGAVYTINLSDIPSNIQKIIVKSYYS